MLKRMLASLTREHTQAYIAFALTTGEFVAGSYLVVHDGHILALYLAITYAMRETSGGKHYHEIVIGFVQRVRSVGKIHRK